MTTPSARFRALRDAAHAPGSDLDDLWRDLEPVAVEEMLGHWRGGDFATGHPVSRLLTKSRWHGKWFDSLLDVAPMVCRDEDDKLFANTAAAGGAGASLWAEEFRGEVTATMVYDRLPIHDHFKRVDENTVMGIMNGKLQQVFSTDEHYHFWLERER